ncbi:importin beta-like protein KAP120 isoform X1 [Gossypium hirsutum]|uniref:Importin beta-like protein KAP120 isoform X1 n=1 Tax=Gossypium hirsutum TaxID=3635 RepID=A0A1U8I858_GOSHI|nr:importin beta-like protein KAP120 isoform X1 [Gossypium hirsutum]XP_016674426.1 importin beta-like protein KAP120 isoform X1 [Gossypium hirsutum]XP_016674427.1 importin beta-like protein KAP120 isoform X1 [Gossypium hirsutum]XP_040941029.1 importin beta-like protein KAP120 isoform X1 [Gossypium hirsutum]
MEVIFVHEERYSAPSVARSSSFKTLSIEKAVIRGLLLSTLDDPNRKLCISVSMAVAAIAVYDWPESWPDLLPFLLKLIGDQTRMNGVKKYGICALINTIAFCFLILNIFSSCFGGLIAVLDGLHRCLFL